MTGRFGKDIMRSRRLQAGLLLFLRVLVYTDTVSVDIRTRIEHSRSGSKDQKSPADEIISGKYRVGFDSNSLSKLSRHRSRFEVAADTIQPQWRGLLSLLLGKSRCIYRGKPLQPRPNDAYEMDLD